MTTCGVALGASRPSCVSTSLPASLQTAAVTGTAWKGSATALGTSGEVQPVTSWTVALPTAACMASAPTVSHCGAQRLLTRRCQWVPVGGSRGSTDLGSICTGNIAYLPARHHGGASAHRCVQSWLVHRVLSHAGMKERSSRELAPAVAASFAAESGTLWRGIPVPGAQPFRAAGADCPASPCPDAGSQLVLCASALVLPSGRMELLSPFPPASEAAVEMVRTHCL